MNRNCSLCQYDINNRIKNYAQSLRQKLYKQDNLIKQKTSIVLIK